MNRDMRLMKLIKIIISKEKFLRINGLDVFFRL